MTFLIVVHVSVCLILMAIILLQPGKSDMGIGFGSSSQSIFGSKGAGNFLTKITTSCAIIFLTTSFFLTRMRIVEAERTVISGDEPAAQESTGAPAENKAPENAPGSSPSEPGAPEKK